MKTRGLDYHLDWRACLNLITGCWRTRVVGPSHPFLGQVQSLQLAFEQEGSRHKVSAERETKSIYCPREYEAGEKRRREQDEHCVFAVVCKLRGACTPRECRICTVICASLAPPFAAISAEMALREHTRSPFRISCGNWHWFSDDQWFFVWSLLRLLCIYKHAMLYGWVGLLLVPPFWCLCDHTIYFVSYTCIVQWDVHLWCNLLWSMIQRHDTKHITPFVCINVYIM